MQKQTSKADRADVPDAVGSGEKVRTPEEEDLACLAECLTDRVASAPYLRLTMSFVVQQLEVFGLERKTMPDLMRLLRSEGIAVFDDKGRVV